MFAVRDSKGRVVRRFRTEAEARAFVRSSKSPADPINSRTIKGAEQIVKAALEKNVIMTVRSPSGDTYTAGPYTPAVRVTTGHEYVAYGHGRSRFLRPEFRGSAWEVARFLVEYCGRGNALEAARRAVGKTIDREALLAGGSQERMRQAREHITHSRNPWAKSPPRDVIPHSGGAYYITNTEFQRIFKRPVPPGVTTITNVRLPDGTKVDLFMDWTKRGQRWALRPQQSGSPVRGAERTRLLKIHNAVSRKLWAKSPSTRSAGLRGWEGHSHPNWNVLAEATWKATRNGDVYAARMFPQAAGTYNGAADLTKYYIRRDRAWHEIGWTNIPTPIYRKLRALLKESLEKNRGRVQLPRGYKIGRAAGSSRP